MAIYLDYDGAMTKVNQAKQYKEQHDNNISNIKNLVKGMSEVWTGNANTQLSQEFDGYESTFNSFSQMLEDYINEMQAWANRIKEADASKG